MGLDTPKRPEVKVKVPKFTKVDLGPKLPDDLRQVEAKQKLAKKVLKKLPKKAEVYEVKSLTKKQKARQKKLIDELVPDLEEIESKEARKRKLDKLIAELKKDFQKWEKEGIEKVVVKKPKKVVSEKLKKRGGAS